VTHTYALLEVSPGAFAEIRDKLTAAGYGHAANVVEIDMHGIGLVAEQPKAEVYSRPECTFNYCPNPEWCKAADACAHKA
jgi:hypothetical protein